MSAVPIRKNTTKFSYWTPRVHNFLDHQWIDCPYVHVLPSSHPLPFSKTHAILCIIVLRLPDAQIGIMCPNKCQYNLSPTVNGELKCKWC